MQTLLPSAHAVLRAGFHRDAFGHSVLSTRVVNKAALASTMDPLVATHESFARLLTPDVRVRVLARGCPGFAHEAGVYIPETDQVWYTSNLRRGPEVNDVSVDVGLVSLGDGQVETVVIDAIACANGACSYRGKLLFCDQGQGSARPSQLVIVDPNDPSQATPILNNFQGRPFNSLNDVVVLTAPTGHTRDDTIWFTDPPYGYEQGFKPEPQLPPQVYVYRPATGDVRAIADGLAHPNGICFSPCGRTCYITDSSHIHGSGSKDPSLASTIYAYDVVWHTDDDMSEPSLRNKRLFAFADCGVPDGIKCDTRGNVYAGCGDGIHVWNSLGRLVGKIIVGLADGGLPVGCANFCFAPGGRLVCFAEDRIFVVEGLAVEGDGVAERPRSDQTNT